VLPSEYAIGMELHEPTPTHAMSSRPSLLKSPETGFAPGVDAKPGQFATVILVQRIYVLTRNLLVGTFLPDSQWVRQWHRRK